jgi:hypothetical protein
MPQFSGWRAVAGEKDSVVERDGNIGGGEHDKAARVAELADGDEGESGQVGNNVDPPRSRREERQIQVSNMRCSHECAVGIADVERARRNAVIHNR